MVFFSSVVVPVLRCQVLVGNVAIVQVVVVDFLCVSHNTGGVFVVGVCTHRSAKTYNTHTQLYYTRGLLSVNVVLV